MKLGVSPWQGYDRAVHHTLAYVGRYSLLGLIPAILLSILSPLGEMLYGPLLLHLGSVPILFPGAFLVNFAALRLYPSRSWRHYPWRAGQAALFSVFVVWSAVAICVESGVTPPRFLVSLIGGDEATVLHYCGLAVVLSSLSLAVVWAVPPEPASRRS